MKSKSHPNPPTAAEINAARKIVQELLPEIFPSLDKDPIPPVMKDWAGQGWHRHDVFVGILIGLQIAKARHDRRGAKKVVDEYAGRCTECGDPNHKAANCDMEGWL